MPNHDRAVLMLPKDKVDAVNTSLKHVANIMKWETYRRIKKKGIIRQSDL